MRAITNKDVHLIAAGCVTKDVAVWATIGGATAAQVFLDWAPSMTLTENAWKAAHVGLTSGVGTYVLYTGYESLCSLKECFAKKESV